MKTYYELLEVAPDASPEQIKQAFRQIISRYHPDKVQHLGTEFQELAQIRSAELTTAYKTLSDPDRRAEYDRLLQAGGTRHERGPRPTDQSVPTASAPPRPATPPPPPENEEPQGTSFDALRSGRDALLRRAALARVDEVFNLAFPSSERPDAAGFDLSCLSRPTLFDRGRTRPWLLAKYVSCLDGQTVKRTWVEAARVNTARKAAVSVFLLSGQVAAESEIAEVIAANRRRMNPEHPINIIPVDVRDWSAWVPTDTDPAVKSVAARLKSI